ncbi:ABC transporter substrate-binding protein [Demequina iriomotensis]|uniref:ABC transporter substrate-binding protein n=1 Tax=Demequina iriomotensis TaxID=1536641 RepID=UPI0007840F69|nr:ABC transporter substrate-binding protein [Demequina iriomotensis]
MQIKSPTSRVRTAFGAVAAFGVLALAACSSESPTPAESSGAPEPATSDSAMTEPMEMTDITVGVIPILDVAPLYLGVQEGFFEDEGLNVTLELAEGGAAIVPGVVSGQFQFGFSNVTSLILATANDLGLQSVAAGVSTTGDVENDFGGVLVKADSGITGYADLAGKKVAVNTLNNINASTVSKAVKDAGGDPSTIEFVELAFPDIVPAVLSGDVDAGQVVEPFLTAGLGQELTNLGSNFALTDPNLMVAEYFTSTAYAGESPEVVAAFAAAMQESLTYANENPDAVRAVLGTYTSMDEATMAAVILPKWNSEIDANTVDLLAELAVGDGYLDEIPDVSVLK